MDKPSTSWKKLSQTIAVLIRVSAELQIRRKNVLFTSGYSEYPTYNLMYVCIYILYKYGDFLGIVSEN
jgi:hypothetical protein